MTYKLFKEGVIDLSIGAFIINDPGNIDWQKYQLWLKDGNIPEPENELTLDEIKKSAVTKICIYIDQKIEQSGYIPQSRFAGEIVSDIAFMVLEYGLYGDIPENILLRVESEAIIYGLTPQQMIEVWKQKWMEMRIGLAPILAQRRTWLLEIEEAQNITQVETILAELEN